MKLNTEPLDQIQAGNVFPVLAPGIYNVMIEAADIVRKKKDDGYNLRLVLKVTNETVTLADGSEVENNGNIVLFRYVSLTKTETYNPNKALKELAVAIGLSEEEDLDSDVLPGCEMRVKVKVRPAEKGFDESNDVAGFYPVAK